jgi:hypothetical protein
MSRYRHRVPASRSMEPILILALYEFLFRHRGVQSCVPMFSFIVSYGVSRHVFAWIRRKEINFLFRPLFCHAYFSSYRIFSYRDSILKQFSGVLTFSKSFCLTEYARQFWSMSVYVFSPYKRTHTHRHISILYIRLYKRYLFDVYFQHLALSNAVILFFPPCYTVSTCELGSNLLPDSL